MSYKIVISDNNSTYKYINDEYSQITRDGKCLNMTKEAKRSGVKYYKSDLRRLSPASKLNRFPIKGKLVRRDPGGMFLN